MATKLVSVRIEEELLEWLKKKAKSEHRTSSNMINTILSEEKEGEELMTDRKAINKVLDRYAKEKRCLWCFHVDEDGSACKECKDKSLWNKEWEKGKE